MTSADDLEKLKYPIGKFTMIDNPDAETISKWITTIEELPQKLKTAVKNFSEEQFNTSYREGGWTVRQVIHHIGDSHLNSYVRLKLALTENRPTIKPYEESLWAELADSKLFPVEDSLEFIRLLHKRWVIILRSLTASQLERELVHPESGIMNLKKIIAIYAWHSEHHLHHILSINKNR